MKKFNKGEIDMKEKLKVLLCIATFIIAFIIVIAAMFGFVQFLKINGLIQ